MTPFVLLSKQGSESQHHRQGQQGEYRLHGTQLCGEFSFLGEAACNDGDGGGSGAAGGDGKGQQHRAAKTQRIQQRDGGDGQHDQTEDGETPVQAVAQHGFQLHVGQMIADDEHRQGDGEIRDVVHHGADGGRQGNAHDEQDKPQHRAHDGGAGDDLFGGDALAVACEEIVAHGEGEEVHGEHITRTIQNADRTQHRVLQGKAHEAAVGEGGGEGVNSTLVARELLCKGHGDEKKQDLQQGGKDDAQQEIAHHFCCVLHLEAAHDGAGQRHVQHEKVKTADGLGREDAALAAEIADENENKQHDDLLQNDEKIVKHGTFLLSVFDSSYATMMLRTFQCLLPCAEAKKGV